MIQILFGLGYDDSVSGAITDAFRDMLITLDKVVYTLIGWIYNILFEIADTSILKSSVLKDFFLRVQLILGVIMIFKVSVSLLQYVINPEAFSDKKNGFGQVISRIIIILVMLAAIIPLNIPTSKTETNSYNAYLNQYGLLFGTMYSLQHRILSNNTIFKLVLGNSTGALDNDEDAEEDGSFVANSTIGERVATYMLKGFISINVHKNEDGLPDVSNLEESDYVCSPSAKVQDSSFIKNTIKYSITYGWTNLIIPGLSNWVAGANLFFDLFEDSSEDSMGYYYNIWWKATTPEEVTQLVNVACKDKNYGFSYMPIFSTICGVILLILIGTYCIDVAVRTLKLAVLQLIAPIAIISYIDPKSNEKGAFASWSKLLISTYLDLFLRLAIFAFISFLCLEITSGGLNIQLTGVYRFFANIFIILGLFYFARIAPKFISDALGLKGMMSNIGLSGVLAATGALRQGGTLNDAWDAATDATNAQVQAYNQGKQAPGLGMAYNSGRNLAAQMITGNEKATYQSMNRGRRRLAEEGITPWEAQHVHDAAIQAQSFTERMADDAKAGRFTYMDANGNTNSYRYETVDAAGNRQLHDVTNADEMSLALSQQRTRSGILKAQDSKVDAEVNKNYQSRSYRDKNRRSNTSDPTGSIRDIGRRRDQYISDNYNIRYNRGHYVANHRATGADITEHL